jgi:hypothetical protein
MRRQRDGADILALPGEFAVKDCNDNQYGAHPFHGQTSTPYFSKLGFTIELVKLRENE